MTTTSPTVRRRIVAAELRRLRNEQGLSQHEVEQAAGLGRASLSRYESCQSSMAPAAARRVFELLGVTGRRLDALEELARDARKRGGWLKGQRDSTPAWFEEFAAVERDASEILEFGLILIPGRLQTESYARGVLAGGVVGTDAEPHVSTRMERASAQRDTGKPRLWVVLREGVLHTHIGGAQVMREQLEYLANMAERPEVTVQIIPATLGAHLSMGAAFTILKFDVAPEFSLVYEELMGGAVYRDDPADVTPYVEAYRHLTACALPEAQSISLIRKTIKDIYA